MLPPVSSQYLASGLVALLTIFYFQPVGTYSDASSQLPDDNSTLVSATRPFVLLRGAPQEFYNVGDPLTIIANLTAYDRQRQLELVVILEVRDSTDLTTLLYSEPGTIPAWGQLNVSLPWVPEKRDAYLIRVYAISDLISPRLLEEPRYWKTMVIETGAKPIVDSVLVGNQTNGYPRIISKTNISNTPISSSHSYMLVQNDTICIVWLEVPPGIDYDPPGTPPMYRISRDGGATFSTTAELEGSDDMKFCDSSDGYSIPDDAHIQLNDTHSLWYGTVGGGGNMVSLASNIHDSYGNTESSWTARLAYSEMVKDTLVLAEGSNVYVFWSDIPGGQKERQLFFTSSSDFGQHVNTTKLRSSLNGNQIWPTDLQILAENNAVLLFWSDSVGYNTRYEADLDWKILCVRSTDGGKTLSGLVDLVPGSHEVFDPHVVYSNGNLYLLWEEYDADYHLDIFFAKSTDLGLTFREG